jgi:hypothetical protein
MDVRLARVDAVNLALVDVEANHLKASLEASVREWESNVTKADDADGGGLGFNLLEEFGSDGVHGFSGPDSEGFNVVRRYQDRIHRR